MAYMEDVDIKYVKKGKFGPLDVYPQEEKQKEDELSSDFVKSGFKYLMPELLRENEYQGLIKDTNVIHNQNFDNDVVRLLLQIVNKKEESSINSQIEANKKQQGPPKIAQTFRPSLILITNSQKTKEQAYAWFKQLANNEPLIKLAKKIPVFNKRADNLPEIMITLYEYQVPITRVVWYLKIMVLAYSTNMNDVQKKKRQPTIDVSSEWSIPLIRFLKEIFMRLQYMEYQQLQQASNGTINANSGLNVLNSAQFSLESFMNVENLNLILLPVITHNYLTEHKLKCLWNFTTKVMRAMLDQNLLDKQYILESLIDLLEKSPNITNQQQMNPQAQQNSQKSSSSSSLSTSVTSSSTSTSIPGSNSPLFELSTTKLILTTILQNMYHFLQSELLSRRLAYYCCKRIANIFNEFSNSFFEKTIKKLQSNINCVDTIKKSTTPNITLPKNSSASSISSLPSTPLLLQQQQKSPELTQNVQNSSLSTKLKPFVTNPTTITPTQLTKSGPNLNTNANASTNINNNEIVNYILKKDVSIKSIKQLFDKLVDCPVHRDQIILFTSIIHAIQLGCMQSLIWNKVGDEKVNSIESPYNGSPLDYLPCPPSKLLYTYEYYGVNKRTKQYVKGELEKAELCIKRRSMAVENKWTSDKLKQASISIMQSKILAILDILDKHCYDLNDVNETVEILYAKIFPKIKLYNKKEAKKESRDQTHGTTIAPSSSNGNDAKPKNENLDSSITDEEEENDIEDEDEKEINRPLTDREIINVLCDWATTAKRCGLHRIFYIVFLIKKRQIDLITQLREANEVIENKIKSKIIKRTKKAFVLRNKGTSSNNIKSGTPNKSSDIENLKKRKFKSNESDEEVEAKQVKLEDQRSNSNSNLNISKKMKLDDYSFDTCDHKLDTTVTSKSASLTIDQTNPTTSSRISNSKKYSYKSMSKKLKKYRKIQLKALIQKQKRLIRQQEKLEKEKELKQKLENRSYEFLFQKVLFDYLEQKAAILDENSYESRLNFANVVSLYYMFISCHLFSHDQLVCTLISRGETFRNNLNDIKRPTKITLNRNRQQSQLRLQYQQSQNPNSNINPRNSIDYASPMSAYPQPASMPPYNLPPHTPLQHQKSFSNFSTDPIYVAPHSVPTPSKSNTSIANQANSQDDYQQQLSVNNLNNSYDNINKSVPSVSVKTKQSIVKPQSKPMSKLAVYVSHLPLPQNEKFQHERNQRFVVLYGFGSKKQEVIEKINSITKSFNNLFSRKLSIDLNDTTITSLSNSNSKRSTNNNFKKHYNTITASHITLTNTESERLSQLNSQYAKLTYYDQYGIINKVTSHLIEIFKTLDNKNYLPKLQYISFLFDVMESNLNIFNLLLFTIKLLHIGPLIEQYLKSKFLPNQNVSNNLSGNGSNNSGSNPNKICYFEYLSYFYLNIIGVIRLHLVSLVLWKNLALEIFNSLYKVIKHIERPSKCSSHEKCALMLLNEMYVSNSYIKAAFPQFEAMATKVKTEKCFTSITSLDKLPTNSINCQMKSDEILTSMITSTDHTIDEIENYINTKGLYYNFVCHVFVSITNLNKDEMLRVVNLCAELTSRCSILASFWHAACKALHHRNSEPTRGNERAWFNELLNKINIQNPRCKENFKLFFSIMASRHCLILSDLIILVVKTCVMACPGITSDQSQNHVILEPSASLACHIIHYLFTSGPRPLVYKKSTYDQRLITSTFRTICFNTFLLVLKCLFLMSDKKDISSNNNKSANKNSSSNLRGTDRNQNVSNSASNNSINSDDNDQLELDQFALNVLYEVREHDWVKERCLNEGDNLLKQNQLLEPTLGRRAQNLLHIIFYPPTHHLRKQNEQTSAKDFIKNILENLDLWSLRESLLEFKLMFELEKQKDNRYHDYFVECLAKTTVEFLIDPEKPASAHTNHTSVIKNAKNAQLTSKDTNNKEKEDNLTGNNSELMNENDNDTNSSTTNEQTNDNENMLIDGVNRQNGNEIVDHILIDTDLDCEMDDLDPGHDDMDHYHVQAHTQPPGIWLIGPLITKLQASCQLKVLEAASKILHDMGKAFWNAKTRIDKESQAIKNITAWNQQPFFSLIMSFLKSKELSNEKEISKERALLTSLFNGLTDFINFYGKEDKAMSEDPRIKQIIMDTLHIRLSLVGSMFEFILKNHNDFINWAWLFVQLIYSGVVDPDNDQLVFTMIIDMLVVLIHHIITLEPNLDANKHYQSIIKKISKETKDFSDVPNTKAMNYIRRLMPLNRSACLDVLTVDSLATTSSKTISSFYDKRRAFKFARKEKISTWELIEGVKNASSLCLSWYGSTKLERKMLRYEYQQKLLMRHKHMNIHRELTYFKDKCEVPNDLIEAVEPTITVVVPPPPPAPVPVIKKEAKTNVNPLSLTPGGNSIDMKINSPSTLNSGPQSADVILIGSNVPPHMMSQPQPMQMHQMNPTHNQVLSRIQQMHQGGQQQQLIQQFQPGVGVNPNDRKAPNRSLSTPDKQRGNGQGSAKKRNPTTPRRANTAVRGATANAAAVAAISNPAIGQPNPMMPNQQYPINQMQQGQPQSQQQKMMAPQQQQTLMPQRSTNSPMLITPNQQQQPPFNNPNQNFMNPNQTQINVRPPVAQQPGQQMPTPTNQMGIPRMPNSGQTNQNFTSSNAQMIQQPIIQTQTGVNPQSQFMSQQQQQQQPQQVNAAQNRSMMQTPGNRMNYAAPTMNQPNSMQQQPLNPAQPQQQQRKLPTQTQQSQQPILANQQKQPGQMFNTINQPQQAQQTSQPNQASRIMPNQSQPSMPLSSQQMYNQKQPITTMPAPRTTTPDPNMMMPNQAQQQNQANIMAKQAGSAPNNFGNAPNQNQNFMQNQQRMPQGQAQMQTQQNQQQQQTRMQFNPNQQNPNPNIMNQSQIGWQQQRQGMQARPQNPGQIPQGQPQQFQQQQQFMQKQPIANQVPMNGGMMQNHNNLQQQQQQQRNLMQQQQPTQPYQNY